MASSDTTFDHRKTYEQILPLLLDDRTRDFSTKPKLFHDTFFDRTAEVQRFRGLLSGSSQRDQTIIITGNAGVGKTSFVYRLAFAADSDAPPILPILADYKAAVPQTKEGCLVGFVQSAVDQFTRAGMPISDIKPNVIESIQQNISIIHGHIAKAARREQFPKVLIFLDDFDYAEDTWYELLDYFLPFVQQTSCAVVLTMRPRLYASIQTYDERLRFYFGRNVDDIQLNPMPAREVLASRLAPILVVGESQSVLTAIISRFQSSGPLEEIATELGLRRVADLGAIDFPFTEKHNDFMQRITNGNLREIMANRTHRLT